MEKVISYVLALESQVSQMLAEETVEAHLCAGRTMEAGNNMASPVLSLSTANIILHFLVLAITLIGSMKISNHNDFPDSVRDTNSDIF